MRTIVILCFGALALFALEIAYSLQIQQYETWRPSDRRPQPTFFRGPVTVTVKALLNLNAAPGAARNTQI